MYKKTITLLNTPNITFENIEEKNKKLLGNVNIARNLINNVNPESWNKIRKLTNIYEDPGSSFNLRDNSPLKKFVISRAFYKLWEILEAIKVPMISETFHICDAPGGFVQAAVYYTKNRCDVYHTMSLKNNSYDVPSYNIKFLKKISNKINILDVSEDNDITDIQTILKTVKLLRGNRIGFITADGGINDVDYNNKETSHIKLISCQILLSLLVLQDNGVFILKVFDTFSEDTMMIVSLLVSVFDTVSISKPVTSRPTNSEKYILCEGFSNKLFNEEKRNWLLKFCMTECLKCSGKHITENDNDVFKQLYVINRELVEAQIDSIEKTLDILKESYRDCRILDFYTRKKNVFCKNFFIRYRLPFLLKSH